MAVSGRRPEERKSLVTIVQECGIKPFTKKNVLFYYSPVLGAVSYSFLSVNVMNPGLVARFIPKRDVTNVLLLNTLIGSGLYIYNRPHLNAAPLKLRIAYSTFGSLMFTFGSVLLWAVLRSVLPHNVTLCSLIGLSSGVTLIRVGQNYLDFVDSQLEIDGSA
ncbi:hypothetical protein B7P43_G06133 [Cryptotermes secundus]|uniref:Uncharacterized protein n=2 Tax=Cryptotermes secundus TaxID=105785 RepID=A0A2J7QPV5_9NEOP|nr:hypothetical protein B7P43_G06133 [Cryptotermes secundus]